MKIRYYSFLALIVVILAALPFLSASAGAGDSGIINIAPTGQGRAHEVGFSPDGNELAVASSLGIHLFDLPSLKPIYFIPTDSWVRALAFSPDGSMLATGSYDPVVRLWRTRDGSLLREMTGHSAWVRDLAFSPDGKLLVTASDDNSVRVWNISEGTLLFNIEKGVDGVRTVAFSPDGTILATGGFDQVIRLWRVSDWSLLRELKGHKDWVRSLAFSPDGLTLASGAFDATVRLWRVEDGELLATREEHSSSVLSLDFSPDGSLLASGSVDNTVRLWKMPEMEPYKLFQGHTDFVFSVAFAPDGRSLASGAVDNTVRFWEVPGAPDAGAYDEVATPSNCKSCHHPRGSKLAPRVIEPACSVCHAGGTLSMNWCPALTRSPGDTTMHVRLEQQESSGFFHPSMSSTIIINSPGNGEAVYGESSISYPLMVTGRAYTQKPLSDLKVVLEILTKDGPLPRIEKKPLPDGSFSFLLEGNHGATEPASSLRTGISIAGEAPCLKCHTDKFEGSLPAGGTVRLKVSLTDSAGVLAEDERIIHVDSGKVASIPVQVLLENDRLVSNLPIRADTRIYEWRGRSFSALADANGRASLQVEALSEYPTTYRLSVPPTVIDGILYRSREPVQVVIPSGAPTVPVVTVRLEAASGEISGNLSGLKFPVQIWAISSPDGEARTNPTSPTGTFSFTELPVKPVILVADPQALAAQGLTLDVTELDLSRDTSTSMDLVPRPLNGVPLSGKITDESGVSLPFAWISAGIQTIQNEPASGSYTLHDLPRQGETATVSAPGYFSQAQYLDKLTGDESVDFSMVQRPETRIMAWGEGTIVVPPETLMTEQDGSIDFEQGWLWGSGSDENLVIRLENMKITISGGVFALERPSALAGWLYILEGQASILRAGETNPVTVQAGEMVFLNSEIDPKPVRYEPVVIAALRANSGVPFQPVWQPSFGAQMRDRLARIGIGTAQIVTFITYFIEFLALIAVLVFAVNWKIKHRGMSNKS